MSQAEQTRQTIERIGEEPEKTAQPSWVQPMLATLTKEHFYRDDWIYERKLDGERCLTFRGGGKIRMYSRNHKLINQSYPELALALEEGPAPEFIIDGEIVAFKDERTSFEQLQSRMHVLKPHDALRERVPVFYYVFDVLYLDGYDIRRLSLTHRKRLLKQALDFKDPLRYLSYEKGASEGYYEEACRQGWEGLIAKRADSPYRSGRGGDWLKFKCINEQEFVIGGYTDPQRSRIGFGALLVGYYEDGRLKYAGRVGAGFSDRTLRDLQQAFSRITRKRSPFGDFDPGKKGVHWVEPQLVAQVSFSEWTSDGKLRQPSFLGLRRDKEPGEVRREG
jgi:bifunctional non-homologous end joining protein LigD